jgi:hypothetical protein
MTSTKFRFDTKLNHAGEIMPRGGNLGRHQGR